MAQASSVPAREPSMEEILASIRRIIEDSDNPQSANATPETAQAGDDPAAIESRDPTDTGSADVEAFRSELTAVDQETELRQEFPAETPPAVEGATREATEPSTPTAETGFAPAQPEPVAYQPPASREPERTEEAPATQAERRSDVVHHEPVRDQAPARASIISETAERQVAAAFEELSDAFASQRRSFDEIAEELMRPMLQDWLDNNLPVLVERLVREEIERVARGAAR